MNRPNIIFIVLDTLRADRMLAKYNDIYLTPFINSLLDKSIYFENCIANSPWTLPSHISMFTGLYPSQIKQVSKEIDKLSIKIPVLAEILKEMGYFTIVFSQNFFVSKPYGLTRGFNISLKSGKSSTEWRLRDYRGMQLLNFWKRFDIYLRKKIKSPLFLKLLDHLKFRYEKLIKYLVRTLFWKKIFLRYDNKTLKHLNRVSQILKSNLEKMPFFLFFNFITTHDPYVPLKEAADLFGITDQNFKPIKKMLIDPFNLRLDIDIKSNRLSEKQVKAIKKLYDSCVFSCDILIKKLFLIFSSLGLLENAYVIITSDHGEHLGDKLDHYLWEHLTYQSVYDSLMKVPLIIFNTNLKKRVVKNQVQLIDLFHTVIHMTGISQSQNKYLDKNKSILNQIDSNTTPKFIFGEYLNPKSNMIDLINTHRKSINKALIPKIFSDKSFVRSNDFKLIKYNDIKLEGFFDLSRDPYEINSQIANNNEVYKKMKQILIQFQNRINDNESIKDIITEKEKDSVKKIIGNIKIKGI